MDEAERRRKQEEALRKFRMRECNVLVAGGTNLEVGVDNVKANLVVAFEPPPTFNTYVQYKAGCISVRIFFALIMHLNSLKFSSAPSAPFKIPL